MLSLQSIILTVFIPEIYKPNMKSRKGFALIYDKDTHKIK